MNQNVFTYLFYEIRVSSVTVADEYHGVKTKDHHHGVKSAKTVTLIMVNVACKRLLFRGKVINLSPTKNLLCSPLLYFIMLYSSYIQMLFMCIKNTYSLIFG